MGFNICHNCGEHVTTIIEKCPKCGVVVKTSTSPIFIGIAIVVVLLLVVTVALIFL
jgi:RNA polymerase subunit RPABC4/transcription elongation factor Spt4